jgi:pyruvate/2-oxoglutarate dehydrogenase complex dihydrolipoamide acyltransferase (E2) component
MNILGQYEKIPFPKNREMVIDVVELGMLKHHVKGFFEVEVTLARRYIKEYYENTGNKLSFTSWIIKCIGQAVYENKHVHALRRGKKELIIFDDVDVLVTVERIVNDENVPLPYVIRKTNEKSLLDISSEIRNAQSQTVKSDEMVIDGNKKWLKRYQLLPKFLRRTIGKRVMRDPFLMKNNVGTVGISAVGMKGKFNGWFIPISPQPLFFALGGIAMKPIVIDSKIEAREFLSISLIFDHDVVDGAPMARFLERLIDLIENCFELDTLVKQSNGLSAI